MMVIVVGRGSGGTRLASRLFVQNGFDFGPVNVSGDLVPADEMYRAARLAGARVKRIGRHEWDFSALTTSPPPPEYRQHVERYLAPLLGRRREAFGFKLPETLLSFPWLVQLYPDAHYLYWTRDPRSAVLRPHVTDYLADFGAPSEYQYPRTSRPWPETPIETRIESWLYQRKLVAASPKPEKFLEVAFEDFVLENAGVTHRIAEFVGRPLVPLREPLARDKALTRSAGFPESALREFGYRSDP